jgi:hypothetical protein
MQINPRVPLLRSQVKTLAVNNSIKSFNFQDMDVNGIVALTNDFKYIYPVNQHVGLLISMLMIVSAHWMIL